MPRIGQMAPVHRHRYRRPNDAGARAEGGRYTRPAMPTYEYVCKSCGHIFEIVQSMKDDPLTECPECGGELRKVFAPPAIAFEGSGFYATDHGKKSKQPTSGKQGSGESSSEGARDRASKGGSSRAAGPRATSPAETPSEKPGRERRPSPKRRRLRFGVGIAVGSGIGRVVMTTAEIGVFGGSGFYSFLEDTETVEMRHPVRRRPARRSPSVTSADGRWRSSPGTGLKHELPAPPRALQGQRLGDEGARRHPGAGPNACGSFQAGVKPGDFVICDQLVDRTRDRPNTFYDGPVTTPRLLRRSVLPHDAGGGDRAGTDPRHPAARSRHRRGDRRTEVLHARRIHVVLRRGLGGHQHDPVPRGDPGSRTGALLHEHLAHHRLRRRRAGRASGDRTKRSSGCSPRTTRSSATCCSP